MNKMQCFLICWWLCRMSHLWDNQHSCECLSQQSRTQPTTPQGYSGSEADSLTRRLPHNSPFFISEWPLVCLGRIHSRLIASQLMASLPQLTPTSHLQLTHSHSWYPTLTPWGYPSTQKFQGGLVQNNQFGVNTGTSDTICCMSSHWDSNSRHCKCMSQPSSTQPTLIWEYSSHEADNIWPGAYHSCLGGSTILQFREVSNHSQGNTILWTDLQCWRSQAQSRLAAIHELPIPENKTELQEFF